MPNKVWDQITYPFPNLNSAVIEVWEGISNVISHIILMLLFIHARIPLIPVVVVVIVVVAVVVIVVCLFPAQSYIHYK